MKSCHAEDVDGRWREGRGSLKASEDVECRVQETVKGRYAKVEEVTIMGAKLKCKGAASA